MEIEKLIERLQNWDGIKPDREIDCAIEGLKALQAENDRLKKEIQQMRWIPVEERLPEESDGAVLLTNGKTVISGYRNQLFGLDGQHGIFVPAIKKGGGYMQVTHWMPLPKLPKEGTNGKH